MGEQAKKTFIVNCVFIAIWAGLVWFAGKFLLQQLLPFVIAVCVAALMQKPAEKLSARFSVKKGVCAAVLSAVLYIVFVLLFVLAAYKAFGYIGKAVSSLSQMNLDPAKLIDRWHNGISSITKKFFTNTEQAEKQIVSAVFSSFLTKISDALSRSAAGIIKAAPSVLFSSIVALAATCYIARDYDKLKSFVRKLLREKTAKNISKINVIFKNCIFKMFCGYLALMFITFTELGIGLFLIGIKNTLPVAFIIAVIDALPVLGAGAVLLPWGLIDIALGHTAKGFGLLFLYLVMVVVRNLAEPKIVAAKTGVGPFFVLLAMFCGFRLIGVAGLVIFPVTLIVVVQYYRNEMEQETS